MAKIINLNQVRKARAKTEKKKQAAENDARFGRSKSGRQAETREAEKARKALDDHEIE